jgi:peptidoglycan/LPS O-acetylase OafA/YrhL
MTKSVERVMAPPGSPSADGPHPLTGSLLARLSRRTSGGRYIPEVDGLRFVAITMVVLFHTSLRLHEAFGAPVGTSPEVQNLADMAIRQGRFGVHLFFILSGFILAMPFVKQHLAHGRRVSLRRYYLRRLTRLEPPYIVALTGFFLLASTTDVWEPWANNSLLPRFGAGLIYSHGAVFSGNNPILPPTWSLEVEAQFYLVVPLLALAFAVRRAHTRRLLLLIVAAAAALSQLFMVTEAATLPATVLSYGQFFVVGFLLAEVFVLRWGSHPTQVWFWDVFGLASWLILLWGWPLAASNGEGWVLGQLIGLPVLGSLIICSAFRGPMTRRALTNRWITTIGGMCYSIYLLHTPLLAALTKVTHSFGGPSYQTSGVVIQFVILAPVVLVISALFFALIERPCMDPAWAGRLWTRLQSLLPILRRHLAPAPRPVGLPGEPGRLVSFD